MFTTLETELYQAAKNFDFGKRAVIIAAIETLTAAVAVFAFAALEKAGSRDKELSVRHPDEKSLSETSPLEKLLFAFFVLTVFVCFILPFLMVSVNAFFPLNQGFTTKKFLWTITRPSFLPSLKNSIVTGFFTALISTIIGFSVSMLVFKKTHKTAAKIMVDDPPKIAGRYTCTLL